jgi:flagellar export protein FliJ
VKKFNFRLQKVLEYRTLLEQWAKEAYLDARASRLEAEMALIKIEELRQHALSQPTPTIESRQTLELQLKQLDQKEVEQRIVTNVLIHEEGQAHHAWIEKQIELEALKKLYEEQYKEWQLEADRHLQGELDEWALRKKAA